MADKAMNGSGAPAAEQIGADDGPMVSGRDEILGSIAAEVLAAANPGAEGGGAEGGVSTGGAAAEKAAGAAANDLSKSSSKQQAGPAPKAAGAAEPPEGGAPNAKEPEWNQAQRDWFARAEGAKTAEELAVIQGEAPEFSPEQLDWLQQQPADGSAANAAGAAGQPAGEDHLKDDAELKGKLTPEVQERVNARIGKVVAKQKAAEEALESAKAEAAQLRQQLESRPVASPVQASGLLATVTDLKSFQEAEAGASAALDQAEGLLDQLEGDPEGAEAVLRSIPGLAGHFKAKDGTEDYSPAKMKAVVNGIRRNADGLLRRELPKVKAVLAANDAAAAEAMQVFPELKDPKSEFRGRFNQVLVNAPWLRQVPNWPRVAAVFALGAKEYERLKATASQPPGQQVPAGRRKLPVPTKIPAPRGAAPTPRGAARGGTDPEVVSKALNGDRKSRLAFISQNLVPRAGG